MSPGGCNELCLRKQVKASLGGRLGGFAIATMVQVRNVLFN